MKYYKQLILGIMCLMCCVSICACGFSSNSSGNISIKYDPSDLDSDDYPFAEETAKNVLKYLEHDENESLMKMFAESVIFKYDINKQIDDAMEFFQGESASYENIRCGIRESSYREESYTYKSVRIVVENVVTDSNEEYDIELEYILVSEEDETQVGISKLFIRDSDDPLRNLCLIGEGGDYSNN